MTMSTILTTKMITRKIRTMKKCLIQIIRTKIGFKEEHPRIRMFKRKIKAVVVVSNCQKE